MNLQEEFAKHFERTDIEGARKWLAQWRSVHDQIDPPIDDPLHGFSLRTMCGHLSDYIEGFTGDEPNSYNGGGQHFIDTVHGQNLFWS